MPGERCDVLNDPISFQFKGCINFDQKIVLPFGVIPDDREKKFKERCSIPGNPDWFKGTSTLIDQITLKGGKFKLVNDKDIVLEVEEKQTECTIDSLKGILRLVD